MSNDLIMILLAIAVVAVALYFVLKPGKAPAAKIDAPAATPPKVEPKGAEVPATLVDAPVVAPVATKAAPAPKAKAPTKPKPAAKPAAAPKAKAQPKPKSAPKAAAPASSVTKATTPAVKAPPAPKPKAAKAAPAAKAAAKPAAPKPAVKAVAKPAPKAAPKAAAKPAAKPVAKAAPKAKGPDNLLWIKGLGPKLNTLFIENGVTRFDQIAGWGATEIAAMDEKLGTFSGRIARDNFVEQAALLAKGDVAAFEAKYGKLDSEN